MNKVITVIAWNINKRSGQADSDKSVSEFLIQQKAEIICLTEYTKDKGICGALDNDYKFAESSGPNNRILLEVRNELCNSIEIIRTDDEPGCFNILHIKLRGCQPHIPEGLNILGVRMLTGKGKNAIDAAVQTPPLCKLLIGLGDAPYICIGDFNIIAQRMPKWFNNFNIAKVNEAVSPPDNFSFIGKDGTRIALDHLILSESISCPKDVSYKWMSFPSYGVPVGKPDHGMLTAELLL